jgi:hypothetical protein
MVNLLLLVLRKVNLFCKKKAVLLLKSASLYINRRPHFKRVVSNLLIPFPALKMRIVKAITTHTAHSNLFGSKVSARQKIQKWFCAEKDPNSAIALKQSLLHATKRWKLGKRIND